MPTAVFKLTMRDCLVTHPFTLQQSLPTFPVPILEYLLVLRNPSSVLSFALSGTTLVRRLPIATHITSRHVHSLVKNPHSFGTCASTSHNILLSMFS